MFALLLPTVLAPVIGRYAALTGPRWWSVAALTACGAVLLSLSALSGEGPTTQALFVLHVALVGACIVIATTAHSAAISVASQKINPVTGQQPDKQVSQGIFRWLTTGTMLSGVNTAWSLGMFLGPASANTVPFTEVQAWSRLCCLWGSLCVLTGFGTWFSWRNWHAVRDLDADANAGEGHI